MRKCSSLSELSNLTGDYHLVRVTAMHGASSFGLNTEAFFKNKSVPGKVNI